MTEEESYLLAVTGHELYRSAVISGGSPDGSIRATLRDRMMAPRPGDIVLEVSKLAGLRPDRWDPDSIGRLARTEFDPEIPPHGDTRYVVAPLHDPEREQGWQNATFIALPDRYQWASAPLPEGEKAQANSQPGLGLGVRPSLTA